MIWCPRYQISFCFENSHLIFCILKMLLSAFQNYLIPSIDPPGWCFNLNIKVLRFAASLFFSLLFKEKYAFQRTRLITLSILSIDCSLWDVREGVRILFSEGLEYIFSIFQCAAMRICWFIKGGLYIFFMFQCAVIGSANLLGAGCMSVGNVSRGGYAWPFQGCGATYGSFPKARAQRAPASPSEVYHARKLQWHFTDGFDFRYDRHL